MTSRRWWLCVLIPLIATVGLGTDHAVAVQDAGTTGFRPLQQLAISGRTLDSRSPSTCGHFDVTQGDVANNLLWRTVYLHANAVFAETSAHSDDRSLLSVSTNGATALQAILQHGPAAVEVDTLGYVEGRKKTSTPGPQASVEYENYLRDDGAKVGRNEICIKLEAVRGLMPVVRLQADSGLRSTKTSPEEIRIGLPTRPIDAAKGEPVTIPFVLTQRGGRPDVGATVLLRVRDSHGALQSSKMHLDKIRNRREGTFQLPAGQLGKYQVTVSVPGLYNEPRAVGVVAVTQRGNFLRRSALPLGVALLGGACSLVVLAARDFLARRGPSR